MDASDGDRPPGTPDDPPEYVPRSVDDPDRTTGATGSTGRPARGDRNGGSNALDVVLDVLERDDGGVVVVSGGSGAGKSRLLAELDRTLRDREGVTVADAGPDDDVPSPPFDGDAVVLLDDAGRTTDVGAILELATGGGRRSDPGSGVTVVAAVRPVHAPHLETEIPAAVDPHRLALEPLDEHGTTELLADLDLGRETVRGIHVATEGHPGLARLLGRAAASETDGRRSPESRLADVVDHEDAPDGDPFLAGAGIVPEFRRYRALSGAADADEVLPESLAPTDAVAVARGLVELRASPLARFDSFDEAAVAERTEELLGALLDRVVESDAPLSDVLAVASLGYPVVPDAVPHDDLVERYDGGDPGPALAGHLHRLAAVCYRREAASGPDAGPSRDAPSTVEHARTWLGRLDLLATRYPDDEAVGRRLARALLDAATHERAAGRLDALRTCVDRLDALADDRPGDVAVQRRFADALRTAAGVAGAAGRVEALDARLERLDALASAHPDDRAIRTALATTLVTATNAAGDAGRLDDLGARLDRLETMASAHPGDEAVGRRLARALLNATSAAGAAGRFDALEAHLDRLETLARGDPHDEIEYRLAQALLNAVNHESAAGRFEAMDASLDRLGALAADNPDDDVRHRLAQALLTAVNREGEAGRLDDLGSRLDRLGTLATDHPDHEAVRVPTTGGYVIAIRHLVDADRYEAAAEAVAELDDVERSLGDLRVGGKGADVQELAEVTGEQLMRDGRLELLEAYVDVLSSGLSGGRWGSVSGDLAMTADSLVGEGEISMETYRRVVTLCTD